MTEDEIVGWHYQFNGHEFEQTLGDDKRQGSLACCSSWRCRVKHDLATEQQHLRAGGKAVSFTALPPSFLSSLGNAWKGLSHRGPHKANLLLFSR